MRLIVLTQNDPFFLPQSLEKLLDGLPKQHQVVACVLLGPSPFGKRSSGIQKVRDTIRIFGFGFLAHYAWRYLRTRLSGRPSVETLLTKRGVPVIRAEGSINAPDFLQRLAAFEPDLLISIAANQIFKAPLIGLAPQGCINLHTSLLPKYRGLMPSFWVLRNGESETGVSVFFVDEGIDSGPILVQKRVTIGAMSQQDLIEHTKMLGMEAVIEAIDLIEKGNPTLLPNPAEEMTYYRFPAAEDVKAFRARGARFF